MIPYRFEQCGYVPVRNPAATDGLYVGSGKRQVAYAKADLSVAARSEAVEALLEAVKDAQAEEEKSAPY